MRTRALMAVLAVSAFALAIGGSPARAQSVPVQPDRTPQQADQAREQDRSRAEDVKIGRDWKAEGGDRAKAGNVDTDRSHETIGRDWRAHPEGQDR
jgi:hypothetical protein